MKSPLLSTSLKQSPYHSRDSQGAILIITIWVLLSLSIFAIGVSKRASQQVKFAGRVFDDLRTEYLVKAAARRVALIFQKDETPAYDSLYEYSLYEGAIDFPEFANAVYNIQDEERLLNLNTAAKEALERIGFMPDVASSLIDWRDPDSVPLPGGAEDSYYKELASPYECKDSNFEAIEELLLVKGVTDESYQGIKDKITIYGSGRLNINTAAIEHLSALGMGTSLINRVIAFRKGDDSIEVTEDDNIFQNVASIQSDLEGVTGPLDITESTQLAQLLPYLDVRSNFLRVDITVKYGERITGKAQALIDRNSGRIIYRYR